MTAITTAPLPSTSATHETRLTGWRVAAIQWHAPGFVDTKIGCFMKPEVQMQRRKFTREFKVEAVRMTKERWVLVAQAPRDLEFTQASCVNGRW